MTLWELVTVGGTPYGEIQPEDLYTHERNENALSSALRPRNVSVLTVPTVCTHTTQILKVVLW